MNENCIYKYIRISTNCIKLTCLTNPCNVLPPAPSCPAAPGRDPRRFRCPTSRGRRAAGSSAWRCSTGGSRRLSTRSWLCSGWGLGMVWRVDVSGDGCGLICQADLDVWSALPGEIGVWKPWDGRYPAGPLHIYPQRSEVAPLILSINWNCFLEIPKQTSSSLVIWGSKIFDTWWVAWCCLLVRWLWVKTM